MIKTTEEVDKIREMGFRPQVVGCFLYDKQLLLVYKKEHDLWQLPQGGIDNNETMREALAREMIEELGNTFVKQGDMHSEIIIEDKIEFPPNKQGTRNLQTDDERQITMKGKKYFFFAISSSISKINPEEMEFDEYKWVTFKEGTALAEKIHQKGKKRITIRLLNKLKNMNLIE
jgi:putative (di)nucleoside polyphosphate hydrolase